ncbi:PaaI family thioesterase [Limimaricola cinnabarinus]|jgi:acyl-coenzyme A thioesterase PaaI-like protein|uniref:Phenylacetic acid degradation-related protein n=1 Tax=Limimaricola cinnabarinus LL-001 TaxID=1337093 RepID=U2YND1_9RHOB|nr:PaaI family thioesterase [Limimaricola cinnabarinus]GAD56791.1 phenylacetic acid degradation-related protein [Limimaricola cinnabarinus LL-001]
MMMDAAALNAFLERDFGQVAAQFCVESAEVEQLMLRLRVGVMHLRPGGTVSGPSMFGLADVAIYLAILSRIGPVALAVTTGATIDFLRKPEAGADLLAETRLLKLGRRLAVGEALLFSEGQVAPVARASMTYSIPPGAAQGAAPV